MRRWNRTEISDRGDEGVVLDAFKEKTEISVPATQPPATATAWTDRPVAAQKGSV
jgi:hypothetical protein